MLQNNNNDFTIDLVLFKWNETDQNIEERTVRLTTFENNDSNSYGTFDESIDFADNTKELSFSIYKYVNGKPNPFWNYLVIGRKVRLTSYLDEHYIEFYITGLDPRLSVSNVCYTIKCQDSFSYELSNQNLSVYVNTDDEEMNWEDGIGPKTIDALIKKTLECSYVNYVNGNIDNNRWHIDPDFTNQFYANTWSLTEKMRVSIETTNTPFNVIGEILELFNSNLTVNYEQKTLNFEYKEDSDLKGLTLRPDYNLSSLTYTEEGEEYCNILQVQGGEDAYGAYVSLFPTITDNIRDFILAEPSGNSSKWRNESDFSSNFRKYCSDEGITPTLDDQTFLKALETVPSAGAFISNFKPWYDSGIIDKDTYGKIEEEININLRNINLEILCYSPIYYKRLYAVSNVENQVDTLMATIAALEYEKGNAQDDETTINGAQQALKITIDDYGEFIKIYEYEALAKPVGTTVFNYGYFGDIDYGYFLPETSAIDTNSVLLFHALDEVDADYQTTTFSSFDVDTGEFQVNGNINSLHFEIYCSISSDMEKAMENDISIGGLNSYDELKQYATANSLCDDTYVGYAVSLYGEDYFANRMGTFLGLLSDGQTELRRKEAELMQISNTADIASALAWTGLQDEDISTQLRYSDLVSRRTQLLKLVGGEGTKQHFDGYYKIYADFLAAFIDKKAKLIEKSVYLNTSLAAIMENLSTRQKQWWQSFYSTYHYVIKEVKYEDENELTSEGLFAVASKQFKINNQPTKSYSISYITTDDLLPYNAAIKIGDHIQVYTGELESNLSNRRFFAQIRRETKGLKIGSTLTFVNGNGEKISGKVNSVEYDALYYNVELLLREPLERYDDIYDYDVEGGYIINTLIPYNDSKPTRLRVSGISKKLRENTTSLTVENNTLVNKVMDKLLAML